MVTFALYMQRFFKYILLFIFFLSHLLVYSQDDHIYIFRKERLLSPYISTDGYGFNYTLLKKNTLNSYSFVRFGLGEIKNNKEIKGVNPRYPNQQRFVFGKVNHIYPIEFAIGKHHKVILKNNQRSVGIRYFYAGGIDLALLKPAYYEIELVYAQDSSINIIDQFDPDYHNINNIVRRVTWFKGLSDVSISPGVSFEFGVMVDFSRRQDRIHGFGISLHSNAWFLPIEIISKEKRDFLHLGFRLYYFWGRIIDDSKRHRRNERNKQNSGWGMLKKH